MRQIAVLLAFAFVCIAQCPLGFTPDGACSSDNPSCGLFSDENGDGLCDNPGPQQGSQASDPEQETETESEEELQPEPEDETQQETDTDPEPEPEDEAEEETPPAVSCPFGLQPAEACDQAGARCGLYADSNHDGYCDNPGPRPVIDPESQLEPELETETESEEELQPEPPEEETQQEPNTDPEPEPEAEAEEETPPAVSCPFGLQPAEACDQAGARCGLYADSNHDGYCDNPGPRPVETDVSEEGAEEVSSETEESNEEESATAEPVQCPMNFTSEEACGADSPLCALFSDGDSSGFCDNAEFNIADAGEEAVTEETQEDICPLNLSPEDACEAGAPICAMFRDDNGNGYCDNPGTVLISAEDERNIHGTSLQGCPIGLPPQAACPDSLALCPHWYGISEGASCANPGGGKRRVNIILIALAVLMSMSTFLSRKSYGRKPKDKLRRNTVHNVVRGVSLMVLGFGVHGCFCPLGTFQYAFAEHGLAFLGLSGVLVFLLPLVFSVFFGRVFCGWVCPMGALQEYLYKINVSGGFSLKGRFKKVLSHLSQVILFGFIAVLLINRFQIVSLSWPAPFCLIDPFHTIFSLFISGSLIVAGATMILAIYIRRFFCRYLCFYGAALGLLARLRLFTRIKKLKATGSVISSDEALNK
ncbi:hypothetical protein CSA37_12550 [Candidatus Fermentibacteria bacterium]|nr:MAG: hypothetical protein CSA37_12550 [Candidatus Fermentibacteria bacterium]